MATLKTFFGRAIQKAIISPQVQAKLADPATASALAQNKLITATNVSFDPVEGARRYNEAVKEQSEATAKGVAVIAAAMPFLAPLAGVTAAAATKVGALATKFASRPPDLLTVQPRSQPVFTDANGNFSIGAAAETLLQIALNRSQPEVATIGPQWNPVTGGGQIMQTALPALPSFLGGLATAGRAAIGVVRSVGGRILGWVLPSGQKVTRKAAVSMAKQFGLQATATALGIGAVELAEAIVDEERRPRRGRGITAAQLRTTKRTIGKLERAHKQIAKAARAHTR